jgi:hypothetical protein
MHREPQIEKKTKTKQGAEKYSVQTGFGQHCLNHQTKVPNTEKEK